MRRTILPILAASLGLAAGGVWLLPTISTERDPSGAPASIHAEPNEDVRALKQEVDALRRNVAALGQREPQRPGQPGEAAPPSAGPPPAAPEPSPPPEPSEEEQRQAAKEAHDKGVKRLESLLLRDAKDAQWTSQMNDQVTAAVPASSGSALQSIDCHESLCRVELAHQDRPALERFNDDLSNNLHYDMDILIEPIGQSFHSVMFLAREGHQMPDWRREMAEGVD